MFALSLPPAALALLSIAMSVGAQFLLKAGMAAPSVQEGLKLGGSAVVLGMMRSLPLWAGFAMYGASAVVWLGVLARWDVSRAYPMVGLGFVLTALIGHLLGEQVGLARVAGIALIVAGVALIGRAP